MKTRIQTKRANKHNRPSCLISTSISVHSMLCCLVIIKIADMWFISLLTVWFGLLQVCYKFVASLLQVYCKVCCKFEYSNSNKRPIQQKPYHTRFGFIGWLIDRIYNKQQYNDQSVNCCKQPTPTPTQTKTPTISYPYPYPYLIIAYSI
jgi:hypothetical protein